MRLAPEDGFPDYEAFFLIILLDTQNTKSRGLNYANRIE